MDVDRPRGARTGRPFVVPDVALGLWELGELDRGPGRPPVGIESQPRAGLVPLIEYAARDAQNSMNTSATR